MVVDVRGPGLSSVVWSSQQTRPRTLAYGRTAPSVSGFGFHQSLPISCVYRSSMHAAPGSRSTTAAWSSNVRSELRRVTKSEVSVGFLRDRARREPGSDRQHRRAPWDGRRRADLRSVQFVARTYWTAKVRDAVGVCLRHEYSARDRAGLHRELRRLRRGPGVGRLYP